jgi:hypothetical protein
MTTRRAEDCTVDTVTIDGTKIPHRTLLLACCQDDAELATKYREIVASLVLPEVRKHEQAAYSSYISAPSRRDGGLVAGHGSFVTGPDPNLQARYQVWTDLVAAYQRAAEGLPPASIPAHRAHDDVRPWDIP